MEKHVRGCVSGVFGACYRYIENNERGVIFHTCSNKLCGLAMTQVLPYGGYEIVVTTLDIFHLREHDL